MCHLSIDSSRIHSYHLIYYYYYNYYYVLLINFQSKRAFLETKSKLLFLKHFMYTCFLSLNGKLITITHKKKRYKRKKKKLNHVYQNVDFVPKGQM